MAAPTSKIVITGAVWAALQAILVAITDFTPETVDSIILTVIIPIVTLLAKITPQAAALPTSKPQMRSSDEDLFDSIFRK